MEQILYQADEQSQPSYFKSLISYQDLHLYKKTRQDQVNENLNNYRKIQNRKNTHNSPRMHNQRGKTFLVRRNSPLLKKLVKKGKIDRLVKNFCRKMKMNMTNGQPIDQTQLHQHQHYQYIEILKNRKGIIAHPLQQILLTVISLVLLIILAAVYSLQLIFPEVEQYKQIKYLQMFGLGFYLIEVLINLSTQKNYNGKQLIYLQEIALEYIKKGFFIDFVSVLILGIDCYSVEADILQYARFIVLCKLFNNTRKLETIENNFITNFNREQYWRLFEVFFINFTFAHVLAIVLNAMAYINPEENWIISHGLQHNTWYQKYVWGYYWGTTIMLTVGFGDYAATNCGEAACLIFIEMFSCITLAYNINCVGNLISNLRSRSAQEKKYLKTFSIMCKSNELDPELETRINNYVMGKFHIQKHFNFEEQEDLLQYLPKTFKDEYLRVVNAKIFRSLPFLRTLTERTKTILAQNICRIVSHPEEIIQRKGQLSKLLILKKGHLGFQFSSASKKRNRTTNIESLTAKNGEEPKLVSLDFIKRKSVGFDIKSIGYSVLYYIENDTWMELLKESSLDFEHFCMSRDRQEYILNQDQLFKCSLCINQFHNKFKCPKLHFIPIRQQIIRKYLKSLKKAQKRIFISRTRQRSHQKNNLEAMKFLRNYDSTQIGEDHMIRSTSLLNSKKYNPRQVSKEDIDNQLNVVLDYIQKQLTKNFEDAFWLVEADVCKQWNYYFPQQNSHRLNLKGMRPKQL